MDKSKEYIAQADCPEIQDGWKANKYNDYVYDGENVGLLMFADGKGYIWLPRQDQLQELLIGKYRDIFDVLCRFTDWFRHESKNDFLTGEQSWLGLIMHELHKKKWSGSEWLK